MRLSSPCANEETPASQLNQCLWSASYMPGRVPPLLDSLDIPQVNTGQGCGGDRWHPNRKRLVYGSHNGGQEVSKVCLEQGHLR